MKLVDLEFVLDAPRADVEEKLSPTSIVEYAGTYDVVSTADAGDDVILTVVAPNELELQLAFTPLENGYTYEQRGVGPFESMSTWITLEELDDGTDRTRVSVASEFTFGGTFAFIQDRLAASTRQKELERLVYALAADLEDGDTPDCEWAGSEAPAETDGDGDGDRTDGSR